MSLYDGLDFDGGTSKLGAVTTGTSGASSSNSIAASSIKFLESQLLLKKAALQQSKLTAAKVAAHSKPVSHVTAPSILEATTHYPQSDFNLKVENEYDPLYPNDYEKVKAIQAMETAKRANPFQAAFSNTVGLRSHIPPPNVKEEPEEPRRLGLGAAIPPPVEKESTDASQVAQKIMAKFGYKAGLGLGKSEQGIASALQVEKTGLRTGKAFVEPSFIPPAQPFVAASAAKSSTTELLRAQTKILLLRNMVGRGEVDNDLDGEVRDECKKYGEVVNCMIYEMPNAPEDEAVRIFVEFANIGQAVKAVVDLNGRFFGGRCVKAGFYDVEKFHKFQLAD